MGLFGGGNSQSTTRNDSNAGSTVTSGTGNISVAGVKNGTVSVSFTDQGTVAQSFNLADKALQFNRVVSDKAMTLAEAGRKDAFALIDTINKQALDANANALATNERATYAALDVAKNLTTSNAAHTDQQAIQNMALVAVAVVVVLMIKG